MNTEYTYHKKPGNGKVIAGVILLLVGGALLINQLSWFRVPDWLFSWPMWIIAFGLYTGAKQNYKNLTWVFIVLVGAVCLVDDMFPALNIDRIYWPLMIIGFGIWIILRRNNSWDRNKFKNNWHNRFDAPAAAPAYDANGNPIAADPISGSDPYNPNYAYKGAHYGDDYLDTVSVFSGAKKTILSKDFKGGEIVNVFGGTEIDFSMADIKGRVIIDVTQIFGGIKMVVPPHWQVVSDVAAVFASTDDKRRSTTAPNADKILVIKGTSIFAGIDIRSF